MWAIVLQRKSRSQPETGVFEGASKIGRWSLNLNTMASTSLLTCSPPCVSDTMALEHTESLLGRSHVGIPTHTTGLEPECTQDITLLFEGS